MTQRLPCCDSFFLFFLSSPLSLFLAGSFCAGYLPFADSCFEHQSERVTCQAVRLWSHPSEGSLFVSFKALRKW